VFGSTFSSKSPSSNSSSPSDIVILVIICAELAMVTYYTTLVIKKIHCVKYLLPQLPLKKQKQKTLINLPIDENGITNNLKKKYVIKKA
jgi:hypothetical protein